MSLNDRLKAIGKIQRGFRHPKEYLRNDKISFDIKKLNISNNSRDR